MSRFFLLARNTSKQNNQIIKQVNNRRRFPYLLLLFSLACSLSLIALLKFDQATEAQNKQTLLDKNSYPQKVFGFQGFFNNSLDKKVSLNANLFDNSKSYLSNLTPKTNTGFNLVPTNSPPVPGDDYIVAYIGPYRDGTKASILSEQVTANDTDPDGQSMMVRGLTGTPQHGYGILYFYPWQYITYYGYGIQYTGTD